MDPLVTLIGIIGLIFLCGGLLQGFIEYPLVLVMTVGGIALNIYGWTQAKNGHPTGLPLVVLGLLLALLPLTGLLHRGNK